MENEVKRHKKAYMKTRRKKLSTGIAVYLFSGALSLSHPHFENEKKNARVLHGNDFCALALHSMQQVMYTHFNINSETYKDMRGKILAIYAKCVYMCVVYTHPYI
jgi:hypothetical protein